MPYFYMGFEMVHALVRSTDKLPSPIDTANKLPIPVSALVDASRLPQRKRLAFSRPLKPVLQAVAYKLGAIMFYIVATW